MAGPNKKKVARSTSNGNKTRGGPKRKHAEILEAERRKVTVVLIKIEEVALRIVGENPGKSVNRCLEEAVQEVSLLIRKRQIESKPTHFSLALSLLGQKGQRSPRMPIIRALEKKKATLKTPHQEWEKRFRQARFRIGNKTTRNVVIEIHTELMKINEKINPGPEVIDGLVHKYGSEAGISHNEAIKARQFFVEKNDKGELEWTAYYAERITGESKPLVRKTRSTEFNNTKGKPKY